MKIPLYEATFGQCQLKVFSSGWLPLPKHFKGGCDKWGHFEWGLSLINSMEWVCYRCIAMGPPQFFLSTASDLSFQRHYLGARVCSLGALWRAALQCKAVQRRLVRINCNMHCSALLCTELHCNTLNSRLHLTTLQSVLHLANCTAIFI